MATFGIVGIGVTGFDIVKRMQQEDCFAGISVFSYMDSNGERIEIPSSKSVQVNYPEFGGDIASVKASSCDMVILIYAPRECNCKVTTSISSETFNGAVNINILVGTDDGEFENYLNGSGIEGYHPELFISLKSKERICKFIKSLIEMTEKNGIINVVFPDITSIIRRGNSAHFITVSGHEKDSVTEILNEIHSEGHLKVLQDAIGLLVHISSDNPSLKEGYDIIGEIEAAAGEGTEIIYNVFDDQTLKKYTQLMIISVAKKSMGKV